MSRFKLDADGLRDLFLVHGDDVVSFFARRTFDAEVAFDLAAETFAQAVASRQRFRGSTEEDAASWLFGIARHLYATHVRHGRVEQRALRRLAVERPSLDDDDIALIEEKAGLAALRIQVAAGLNDLSAEHRQALQLRVVEERSYAYVASAMAVSEDTARARVSRALRKLGAALSAPPITFKEST